MGYSSTKWGVAAVLTIAVLGSACSAEDEPSVVPGSGGNVGAVPGTGAGAAKGVITVGEPDPGGDSLPAEDEVSSFRPPVVAGQFLWSANPDSGRVALLDGKSLAIRIVSAGLAPTYLAALPSLPENPRAVVINTGSSDATVMELEAGVIVTSRVEVHAGANQWTVSPDGRFAAAWTLAEDGEELDPTEGLQDLTLVNLSGQQPSAERWTVGYRPSLVTFDQAGSRLVVVAEDGISVIELETQTDQFVSLELNQERDVSITSDGRTALMSFSGSGRVKLMPLANPEAAVEFELSGPITDLDLASSGRALAVVRRDAQVATFLVDEVLADPAAVDTVTIEGELVGSAQLSSDGRRAVLFTNAVRSERVTVLELDTDQGFLGHRSLTVHTPVERVFMAPGGAHAVAVGRGQEGATTGAFAVLSLEERRFPLVVGTDAPIQQVALGAEMGVISSSQQGGPFGAYVLELSVQRSARFELASPPLAVGVVDDPQVAFVSQNHPEGRVTFFNLDSSKAQTLTGFELAAEVVE